MLRNDEFWMKKAIEQAEIAELKGEVPVGAITVCSERGFVAGAFNQTIYRCDPTAHAEMEVIRQTAQLLGNYRLPTITLYVTLEPCAMCAGAIVQARIPKVVFASRDFKSGAAGSCFNILNHPVLNHRTVIDDGVCQAETSLMLKHFFEQKR